MEAMNISEELLSAIQLMTANNRQRNFLSFCLTLRSEKHKMGVLHWNKHQKYGYNDISTYRTN